MVTKSLMMQEYTVTTPTNALEVVLACVKSINEEDFTAARSYVHEDMTFEGVLGSRNGAAAYFADMEKMKLKYDLQRTFANGDDVCLLYKLNMQGQTIFCCGWYTVKDGKIVSLKVVFDPRPVLEKSNTN